MTLKDQIRLSDAQREALEVLADNGWCYTTMRRTNNGSINRSATECLVTLGLARWRDYPHTAEVTDDGMRVSGLEVDRG